MFLFFFIFAVFVLLSIAFLTLLERNFLGYSQIRKSPNKSSLMGVLQAVFDGVKLLRKLRLTPSKRFTLYFVLTPFVVFIFLFLEWGTFCFTNYLISFRNSILFFLCLVGFVVYFIFFSGLLRTRKYRLLGRLRRRSQRVSFELVFFFFIFVFMGLSQNFSFIPSNISFVNIVLVFFVFILVLVELGRTPFDFPERERELVRGYNTEYRSYLFVLLFLSEYGFIVFFRCLMRGLFFNHSLCSIFIYLFLILIIRRVYPRLKYDQLMGFF